MATITGFTAAKIQELIDQGVGNPVIDGDLNNGHLILGFKDETTLDIPLADPDAMVYKKDWSSVIQYKRGQAVLGSNGRLYIATDADPLVADDPTVAGGSGGLIDNFDVGAPYAAGGTGWSGGYGSIAAGPDGAGYWYCGNFPYGGTDVYTGGAYSGDAMITAEMKAGVGGGNEGYFGFGFGATPTANIVVARVNFTTGRLQIMRDINGTFGGGAVLTTLADVAFAPSGVQWLRLERKGLKFIASVFSSDPSLNPSAVPVLTLETAVFPSNDVVMGPGKVVIGTFFDGGQTAWRSIRARAATTPGDWTPITPAPVTIPAPPAWTNIPLHADVSSGDGGGSYNVPQYRIYNGELQLRGALIKNTAGNSMANICASGTIPVAGRPTKETPVFVGSQDSGGAGGHMLSVMTDGAMRLTASFNNANYRVHINTSIIIV